VVTTTHPLRARPLRPAFVLWNGKIGGAEIFTVELTRAMRACGAEPAVIFIQDGLPLAERLDRFGIPHAALGLHRGRAVLRVPRLFARTVSMSGPDAAILVESGFLVAALRAGGYRAPIIGLEHGSLLRLPTLPPMERLIRKADRLSGTTACSVVVAVSEYMRDHVAELRPRRRVVCIPNGVDLQRFSPADTVRTENGEIIVGCAARLIEGKGIEDVIEALAHPSLNRVRLRVAGDGPHAGSLEAFGRSLGVDRRVEFLGPVLDMPAFWRSTDVAVAPSNTLVEGFGMTAVEAMACGKPVIASESGALPSIVADGETGCIIAAGDSAALATAIAEYAADPARRARHGSSGRRRCEEKFGIDRAARRYLELCANLIREANGTE
jgi:glycosyltransferase involved in cell wall biosynthesis